MLTKEEFKKIMKTYGKAWESLDTEAVVKIFDPTATYDEGPFRVVHRGHAGIKKYWQQTMATKEKDIRFTLGNIYVDGNCGIAEWKATFRYRADNKKQELRGIIVAEIKRGKIHKLWEYWHKKNKH